MILFDEPFVGQDPITMGVLVKLIDELNHSLGITCVVVSHDVPEVLSIADYAYIVADQRVVAQGVRKNSIVIPIRELGSSLMVLPTGQCRSVIRQAIIAPRCLDWPP